MYSPAISPAPRGLAHNQKQNMDIDIMKKKPWALPVWPKASNPSYKKVGSGSFCNQCICKIATYVWENVEIQYRANKTERPPCLGFIPLLFKHYYWKVGHDWVSVLQWPPPFTHEYFPHKCPQSPSHPPPCCLLGRHFTPLSFLGIVVCTTVDEGVPCISLYRSSTSSSCPERSFSTVIVTLYF